MSKLTHLVELIGETAHRTPGLVPADEVSAAILPLLGARQQLPRFALVDSQHRGKLERELKDFVTEHRADMGKTKSKTLTFGEVSFRLSTAISLPRAKDKLEEIVRKLKARKMLDCIVTKEEVSKEALKKYGEDTVNAVGATWKQKDVFGYEVNLARLQQIKGVG